MTKKYTVTFGETTATRGTEHVYTHAACRRGPSGWKVTFHKNYTAAKRAAGRFGEVKAVKEA